MSASVFIQGLFLCFFLPLAGGLTGHQSAAGEQSASLVTFIYIRSHSYYPFPHFFFSPEFQGVSMASGMRDKYFGNSSEAHI